MEDINKEIQESVQKALDEKEKTDNQNKRVGYAVAGAFLLNYLFFSVILGMSAFSFGLLATRDNSTWLLVLVIGLVGAIIGYFIEELMVLLFILGIILILYGIIKS